MYQEHLNNYNDDFYFRIQQPNQNVNVYELAKRKYISQMEKNDHGLKDEKQRRDRLGMGISPRNAQLAVLTPGQTEYDHADSTQQVNQPANDITYGFLALPHHHNVAGLMSTDYGAIFSESRSEEPDRFEHTRHLRDTPNTLMEPNIING